MAENILLDFSHIYSEEPNLEQSGIVRIDLSDISGTDMYCTQEAADEIRRRVQDFGSRGIHFLDSGNYHYATLFFVEKIREPFSLVLVDHHTDMQKPMIPSMISCGSWAGEILKKSKYLRQMILIGPEKNNLDFVDEKTQARLICISMEDISHKEIEKKLLQIDQTFPIYISIDKDVLSSYYARTNWNQGNMSIDILEKILLEIFLHQKVIGVDICGECNFQEPLPRLTEDMEINHQTNQKIYYFLRSLFGMQSIREGRKKS